VVLHTKCFGELEKKVEPAVAAVPVGADFGWVLVFAMRHIAWGRKNERDLVMQYITRLIPYLGDSTLAVLDKDMAEDYAAWGGDPVVYEAPWRELHTAVKQERRRRVGIANLQKEGE
jgi:hypothetical protein